MGRRHVWSRSAGGWGNAGYRAGASLWVTAGLVLAVAVAVPVTVSAAQGTTGPATKVTAPSDAGADPGAVLRAVSCPSVGNCAGVGSYVDGAGNGKAMMLAETNGTWGKAIETPAPSDADSNPQAFLASVSCTSPNNCVAVGSYRAHGNVNAMAVTEMNGTWGPADPVAGNLVLAGVSCVSPGNCVAVGYDQGLLGAAMAETEMNGTWAQEATKVAAPSNAAPRFPWYLYGVSCVSVGNCTAVGNYFVQTGPSNFSGRAMEATETANGWQATEALAPPDSGPDPVASLSGVSCTSVGNCFAVGKYYDGADDGQAMATSETNGTWASAATKVAAPSNAGENPVASLAGVSCTSGGDCAGVGQYTDRAGSQQATVVVETNGAWAQATRVIAPTDASNSPGAANLAGVSCTSPGNCVGVGGYADRPFHGQAMRADQPRPLPPTPRPPRRR